MRKLKRGRRFVITDVSSVVSDRTFETPEPKLETGSLPLDGARVSE